MKKAHHDSHHYKLKIFKGHNTITVGRVYDSFLETCPDNELIRCLSAGVCELINKNLLNPELVEYPTTLASLSDYSMNFVAYNLTQKRIERGLLLLIATKINWWKNNHPVNKRYTYELSPFMYQVIYQLFSIRVRQDEVQKLKKVIFVASNWMNARIVIKDLLEIFRGVRSSLHYGIEIPKEILHGISCFPAGTTLYSQYYDILRCIRKTPYNMAAATDEDIEVSKFLKTVQQIKADPAKYHIGWEDDPDHIKLSEPNNRVRMICSAYIHATNNTDTHKVQGILPFEQIQSNMIYLRMRQIYKKRNSK